jgi:hypothetical protein
MAQSGSDGASPSRNHAKPFSAKWNPDNHKKIVGRGIQTPTKSSVGQRPPRGSESGKEIASADTTQANSFSNASAPARDEAGFWPVTSFPSVTTKLAQSAAFS